ncbi:MAG: sigma-54-dependent Fis family transcriptional regulator [Candidatus Tectomicrobia bacterium]|uniref:Sigma-54-dependent Fis family transcriptional regulator n=1 Tax=Tectimicrobiota bacterium TaxID=2528274 RepID=A0A937W290_UNCTE|nr:sigma-54-dependent Fis family transcriptional regulator [Candidatus Tectomicrobia bacterium]
MSPPRPLHRAAILVLDDDRDMGAWLTDLLTEAGYTAEAVQQGPAALAVLAQRPPDVLITDLVLHGMQGMDVLRQAKQLDPSLAVVMITAFGTIESAVEAMRLGAFYYLTKPFKGADLLLLVERALEEKHLRTEVHRLQQEVERHYHFDQIIGKSQAMQRVFALVDRLAESPVNVLLTGESGTGKDRIARTLHYHSRRKQGPFVPVNCAALPEALLESELFGYRRGAFTDARTDKAGLVVAAQHGTLFLDEIGELPLPLQAKLLRVIEDKEVRPLGATHGERIEVRLIAATNRDLRRAVAAGEFRQDLFYRLNVVDIHLPPLRERLEDLPLLLQHFLAHSPHASRATRLSESALRLLFNYPWPGNVRELENTIERALVLCQGEEITPTDLPPHLAGHPVQVGSLRDALQRRCTLADLERDYILLAVEWTAGKKTDAAELLGIDRKTLYRKLVEYGQET